MPEFSKHFVIFCFGFFSLLSQVLLFRDFLTVMEGNELAIGLFFFSWLLWISIGAMIGRIKLFSKKSVIDNFEVLILIYIPALILQQYILLNIRQISGTASYEQIALVKALPLVFMSNAAVSFITGFAFVLACRWTAAVISASAVYISESLGSFAGAVAVTIFLFYKVTPGVIITAASLLLIVSSFICLIISKQKPAKVLFVFSILAVTSFCFDGGYGKKIDKLYELHAWERMLAGGEYAGNFLTSQAKYSYGKYADQFIVSAWGSIYESLPNSLNALETAAVNLAEKPDAQNILIAGNGSFSLCSILATLKQVKKISWLEPDSEYPENLLRVTPPEYKANLSKVLIPSCDIRQFLSSNKEKYDLIIMNMPNPSTLFLNRYFTLENFVLLKNNLSEKGVLSVSFPGGDNYMGNELSYSGASLFYTLQKVFKYISIKPGDDSFFFASDSENALSEDAAVLEKRLLSIDGFDELYPAKNINSSFMKERIKFQKDKYAEIIKKSNRDELVNSDVKPKSYLYCLLLTVKKLGGINFNVTILRKMPFILFFFFAAVLLGYGIIRIAVFSLKNKMLNFSAPEGFLKKNDVLFIILAVSIIGMVFNIILIFRYQMVFGSVFLNFGILTSLFMLGNFSGGMFMERMIRYRNYKWYYIPVLTIFFAGFIILADMMPLNSQMLFGILFFLTGFFSGAYFPLVAFQVKKSGCSDISTGSNLETLDCLGGAAGAIITAVIMLPLIGMQLSIVLLLITLGIVFLHSTLLAKS